MFDANTFCSDSVCNLYIFCESNDITGQWIGLSFFTVFRFLSSIKNTCREKAFSFFFFSVSEN